jgi:hypothetical protein
VDKESLARAVIEDQNEWIVGGQEPMLAKLDSLDGIRAWGDFLIEPQRQLGCRGGCPIGSLGNELAEIDPQARAALPGGLLLSQVQRSTEPLKVALDTVIDCFSSLTAPGAS